MPSRGVGDVRFRASLAVGALLALGSLLAEKPPNSEANAPAAETNALVATATIVSRVVGYDSADALLRRVRSARRRRGERSSARVQGCGRDLYVPAGRFDSVRESETVCGTPAAPVTVIDALAPAGSPLTETVSDPVAPGGDVTGVRGVDASVQATKKRRDRAEATMLRIEKSGEGCRCHRPRAAGRGADRSPRRRIAPLRFLFCTPLHPDLA